MLPQCVTDFLYWLLVRSRLVYCCLPFLSHVWFHFLSPLHARTNHWIRDEAGVRIGVTKVDGGKLYPAFGVRRLETVKDVRVRLDDVVLCGYPKTGCHWTFEILTMLTTGRAVLSHWGKGLGGMVDMMPDLFLDSLPSPRVLNSHFRYVDLPRQTRTGKNKIILTMRGPKDTVVSFYNHHRKLVHLYAGYDGEFRNFFKLFMEGNLEYGSYFEYYRQWAKYLNLKARTANTKGHGRVDNPCDNDIFLLRFEELKRDPVSTIEKIAEFLEIDITDQFARQVATASNFSSMKATRSTGESESIFRKGVVGDWSNWLTEEQSDQMDREWTQQLLACYGDPL